MCFGIRGLKTLKLTILRFVTQPPTYTYYLNSSKNILLLKDIIDFVIINSVIIFENQKSKTPSDGTCLGEPVGGFCDVDLHFAVVILHLSMFFIHILFSKSSLTLPWNIEKSLDPFCNFSPVHRRVICHTFIFNHSVIFLPRALRF